MDENLEISIDDDDNNMIILIHLHKDRTPHVDNNCHASVCFVFFFNPHTYAEVCTLRLYAVSPILRRRLKLFL